MELRAGEGMSVRIIYDEASPIRFLFLRGTGTLACAFLLLPVCGQDRENDRCPFVPGFVAATLRRHLRLYVAILVFRQPKR